MLPLELSQPHGYVFKLVGIPLGTAGQIRLNFRQEACRLVAE